VGEFFFWYWLTHVVLTKGHKTVVLVVVVVVVVVKMLHTTVTCNFEYTLCLLKRQ